MFKSLLLYFCKSTPAWAIRVDGKILASWVHIDKAILNAAIGNFPSPEYKTVEVIPVRIISVL